MKHKVSELEGVLLDAAVVIALAGGVSVAPRTFRAENGNTFILGKDVVYGPDGEHFHPSTDWADGGPIIERERIAIYFNTDFMRVNPWVAGFNLTIEEGQDWGGDTGCDASTLDLDHSASGPTPLIAAMRAYVASKFGDEVEL